MSNTNLFKAILLVRALDRRVERQPLPLVINPDPYVPDVDLRNSEMLYNLQAEDNIVCWKSNGKPWHGAKQKSELLLKTIIHGICPVNGTIVDFKTGVDSPGPQEDTTGTADMEDSPIANAPFESFF